ncbi:pre-mRNA-splicing regulator WTAP [Neodiprion pinetum]|uniref:Pre-mRNA-splicing regulator WTAP n=1 Tax=Neodiprion lecontei TaxID=441921 RepID=A0A6J0BE36_NEOLC|nr:pre-mRNA-splicing regulator WTAP [Neodiprion lecontei]XP_015513130.1 pre-mRNA-splicing regulator WTAP [Neodiprion lecontei]XP_046427597.1 pre-mRNA-splicing regulator WTAP [Neodiprion fabricii]XP_046427607.1 pre-mRNA-splicing regulator WTAP [Neodiprion fabricii]XP_046427616.1 pre-mRNA-splicing regulator WTAP [Neodiprion fabricii]XP_046464731.1 pre-mRNA-splicing regulator WTAP [Neodiprion pinetum]XP_046464732.1 pre-mRNA-splicing regulator WTAP [Neodiprion pinetum]XP_046464733.1 pre-mRNA-spl
MLKSSNKLENKHNCIIKMAEESMEVKSAGPSSPRSPQSNGGGKPNSPPSPLGVRQPRRIKLTEQQLDSLTRDELALKWREQDLYVEYLEAQATAQEGELASLRDSEDKYRQQYAEASHREKILVRRLASKEQELQEYVNQISEMKAAQAPSAAALKSALLDPAVNILIQRLRQELITTKAKLEDTQNELSAWKFTPDSNTGKRLMAKCRLLYQENEELGRMIASGRIAKLEGELALQKSFSEEVKKSQSELDEFLQDLDEDVEGMQSTIYFLQQELRKARESVTLLQQENITLKSSSGESNLTNGMSPHTPPIKKEEVEESTTALEVKPVKPEESDVCKGARTPPLPPEASPRSDRGSVEKSEKTERMPSQTDLQIDESSSDSAALIIKVENEELSDRDEEEQDNRNSKRTLRTKSNNKGSGKSNGEEVTTRTTRGRDRAKREKSAAGSDDERTHKKKRRESVLSLDYNEADDDALVLTNGETLQSDPE